MQTSYYPSTSYSTTRIPPEDTPSTLKEKSSEKNKKKENKDVPTISTKGGVKAPFPVKLMDLLNLIAKQEPQLESIISWQPSGESFKVRDKNRFVKEVQSNYFTQTNYTSFRRQLNLWGFKRIEDKSSEDYGCYFNPMFKRDDKYGCRLMRRLRGRTDSCQATAKSMSFSKPKNSANVSEARSVSSFSKRKENDTPRTPSHDEIVLASHSATLVSPMNEGKKSTDFIEETDRRVSVSKENNNTSYWILDDDQHTFSRTLPTGNLTNMRMHNDGYRDVSVDLSLSSSTSSSLSLDTSCHYPPRSLQDDFEPMIVDEGKECTLPHNAVVLFLVHAMQESDCFQTELTNSCHPTFDSFVW